MLVYYTQEAEPEKPAEYYRISEVLQHTEETIGAQSHLFQEAEDVTNLTHIHRNTKLGNIGLLFTADVNVSSI